MLYLFHIKTQFQEFECRQTARAEGRRYCDPVAQRYQLENMPETIRLKIGSASPQQMSVYEEFARHVPGFASTSANSNFSDLMGQQSNTHNRQHNVSNGQFCRMLLWRI